MSEKELKEGIKYELKALQENESDVWKFPKKAKEQALDWKLLKTTSTKHFPILGSHPGAAFYISKGFAEALDSLIAVFHMRLFIRRKEP